ncbi:MAG: alpha/beta hydrolase, partial [Bacteroidota bacterium]
MKKVFKILKWTLKLTIGSLALIIIAGLGVRIFGPTSHEPTGELVDIGGINLHIHATGEKNNRPTLVIEGGRGTPTVYYHWLSEGLKDRMRVVRYDRAGLGYSDRSKAPRTPEFIAQELHQLLENAGEKPPYILMGHSLGGNYVRVFTELYPDEVHALFLLDAAHPNRVQKIPSTPSRSSWKFKLVTIGEKLQAILGDLGVLALYDILTEPAFGRDMEGLPDEITDRTLDLLLDGKHFRTMADETLGYHETLARAGEKTDFGTLPIRIV